MLMEIELIEAETQNHLFEKQEVAGIHRTLNHLRIAGNSHFKKKTQLLA